MNINWIGALVGLGVLGATSVAHTQSENLFTCIDRGFILQQCVLTPRELASPGVDANDGKAFETDYVITYDFPCRGSAATVGIRAGADFHAFRMGAQGETLQVSGSGPLVTDDPAPERTLRFGFRPGCKLVVRDVTRLPSMNTIALWTVEARDEARILAMTSNVYVLSKSFAGIATFDRAQLAVVIEATQARVDAAADPIDRRRWRSLLDSLVAMRDAQPIPVPKAEVDAYLVDLAEGARASLLREADTARAMSARFTTWSLEVERTLRDAIATVPAI